MWEFFLKGGVMMIPLGFCSFAAIIIIIERLLFFYITNKDENEGKEGIIHFLRQGKLDDVKSIILRLKSGSARITEAAIEQTVKDKDLIETAVQSAGAAEVKRLERGLGMLDTIVTASPLLGLLGTVTGIIRAFTALSVGDGVQATQLSLGIAEALYTTAFGLAIAIPSLFFLNYFYKIAEHRAEQLTNTCQEILTILNRR
ncbi:MAG: MotA/TolQ/ExbB proton channel family protein [Bacteroidota bacterium]